MRSTMGTEKQGIGKLLRLSRIAATLAVAVLAAGYSSELLAKDTRCGEAQLRADAVPHFRA